MRKYGFLVFFLALLLVGGVLTVASNSGGIMDILPFLQQTSDPAASTDYAEAWQAEQLFLLIGFIVVNLVGIGATLAGLFWFLNRGVRVSQAESQAIEQADEGSES
ncbi:MAG: hypothetical protein ACOCYT_05040 [Chloroflexota bacterium]